GRHTSPSAPATCRSSTTPRPAPPPSKVVPSACVTRPARRPREALASGAPGLVISARAGRSRRGDVVAGGQCCAVGRRGAEGAPRGAARGADAGGSGDRRGRDRGDPRARRAGRLFAGG